ncbi:hypothetical protein [Lysobacter enzymogenes]|uniref:hypothetical protein n=1 Tax=Lysobacter enzymogenes TaxID=69 RepID=UPI001A979552|nr:hypothetical protein [Lysobacter enzymogenes]QQP97439.1 hypothetical protein JHW38_05235 [Lysobacter enzymogenes]
MRPYDGVDYRYSSVDADKTQAYTIIANILGVPFSATGLEYELSFYSGGTGCDDRLAIRFKSEPIDWDAVHRHLQLHRLGSETDSALACDLFDGIVDEASPATCIDPVVRRFINSQKRTFQDVCDGACEIAYTDQSHVNTWCFVWRKDGWANYLFFDQG